jgi:hypothetical protein
MAFHRWASGASAGLSRHVSASILRQAAAKAPRISKSVMIQAIANFLLPPSLPAWSSYDYRSTPARRAGLDAMAQRGHGKPSNEEDPAEDRAWAGVMGVRRQGLEPRTVALRGHCSAN